MPRENGLENLRDKIKNMANPVERHVELERFVNVLSHEKNRAERYNRYFSLLLIVTTELQPDQIIDNCTHCLRVTDELGVLTVPVREGLARKRSGGGAPAPTAMVAVGVLLPETPPQRSPGRERRLPGRSFHISRRRN